MPALHRSGESGLEMRRICAVTCLLLASAPALAAGPPKLNVEATCKATPAVGADRATTAASCLRDEQQARLQLPAVWAKSSRRSQTECVAETRQGGLPSYVELLTCLQGNLITKTE